MKKGKKMNKTDENKIRTILIDAMELATDKISEENVVNFYWHAVTAARMAEAALQVVLSCEETNEERTRARLEKLKSFL